MTDAPQFKYKIDDLVWGKRKDTFWPARIIGRISKEMYKREKDTKIFSKELIYTREYDVVFFGKDKEVGNFPEDQLKRYEDFSGFSGAVKEAEIFMRKKKQQSTTHTDKATNLSLCVKCSNGSIFVCDDCLLSYELEYDFCDYHTKKLTDQQIETGSKVVSVTCGAIVGLAGCSLAESMVSSLMERPVKKYLEKKE